MLLAFKSQFEEKILAKEKRHTIQSSPSLAQREKTQIGVRDDQN